MPVLNNSTAFFGEGDIGFKTGADGSCVLFFIANLNQAVGVGCKANSNFKYDLENVITLDFPKDSPDSLDILIAALQNVRDKYYKDIPKQFTQIDNPIIEA